MPETIREEYGSGQYFLRGLSREMRHMAAGPGELCSPCEPCSCGQPCQAQEDASLKVLMRQKGEAKIVVSVSGCKHFSMISTPTPAAAELSVWPVCLAPFLSKLWKSCWKLMLPLLLPFFFFFNHFFSIFYFCIWMLAGSDLQVRAKSIAERLLMEPSFLETAGLRWAGEPGNVTGSWLAANPEVPAAPCFCTHCWLTGAWSSSL